MKLHNKILTFLLIVGIAIPLLASESTKSERYALGKTSSQSTGSFDGNRISDDLENNGMIVSHRISGHSGLEWPKGAATYAIYASGVWMAGKVDGDIRSALAEYEPEYTSGPYGSDGFDPSDRLYKVNKVDLNNPGANPDFAAWPVDKGAPWVDEDGDGVYTPMPGGVDHPKFIGDQVIYYVMNDGVESNHSLYGTPPLGIEVQTTIWGYDRNDAFGDMMFVRSRIFNKGGNSIDDAFLGLWSDPDLGNAGDDFVGCDTVLSLGFCYNDGDDNAYGTAAPAVGYDFFQAAFPSGDMNDTTYAFDEFKAGYENLNMSSFVKYINSDPTYTDPNDETEAYNYLSGFLRDRSPFINSATGQPSKFVHPDDPNDNVDGNDLIWVDSDDNPADDRRFLMNVGPFNFAPGDSAEVVYGILISQGADALSSVTKLKEDDILAQKAYDVRFALPDAPPIPVVQITPAAGTIVLEWDNAAEDYTAFDNFTETYYEFEGYNVYQFETANGSGAFKKIASYDLVNGITTINDIRYVSEYGANVLVPVQRGTDSGLKHTIAIRNDALNSTPLIDDRTYYFAVTAYGYGEMTEPHLIESSFTPFEAKSQTSVYVSPVADLGDAFEVTHNSDALLSDGVVTVRVINPSEVTGHDYKVYFDNLTPTGPVVWNVLDVTTNMDVLSNETVQSGLNLDSGVEMGPDASLTFDGLQVVVNGPSAGFHGAYLVQAGAVDRSFAHDDINYSIFMEDVWAYGWNDDDLFAAITFPSDDPICPDGRYWITQGGGTAADNASYVARVLRNDNADRALPYDYEVRWLDQYDESTWSWGIFYGIETAAGPVKVPFELWNIGIGTPDDTSDDVRMIPRIYDYNASGDYDWMSDVGDSGGQDDAHTDWVYWWQLETGTTWAEFEAAAVAGDVDAMSATMGAEVLSRTIFMNHNGAGGHEATVDNSLLSSPLAANWTAADTAVFIANNFFLDDGYPDDTPNSNAGVTEGATAATGYVLPFPSTGSVFRWITNKPNALVDNFTFSTAGYGAESLTYDPDNIKVWPNPYFGYNPEERTPLQNMINFINLPEMATINIYSLAGQLVRTLEHSGGQEETWDAQNSFNVLVASGVYIAVVSPAEGDDKVLKLAVVMPAQRLDVY